MRLDEFSSRFRRAAKSRLAYAEVRFPRIALVCDLPAEGAAGLLERARAFLGVLQTPPEGWTLLAGADFDSTDALLRRLTELQPDLVVTYRALQEREKQPRFSLGTYLDVLIQVLPAPVLVLPSDDEGVPFVPSRAIEEVMVVTDHLTGDHRLVNVATAFLRAGGGKLFLTHVEDDQVFRRYIEVIAKLPSIDTETAERDIGEQLLREPGDYIATCREVLTEQGLAKVEVHSVVRLGHRVRDYAELVEQHEVDLLVFNGKDGSQLAMHGLSYSLATEMRQLPLLIL